VWHNGVQVVSDARVALAQGDRVLFGNNHLFRLNDPTQPDAGAGAVVDWEGAQREIAMHAGAGDLTAFSKEADDKAAEELRRKMETMEAELAAERARVEAQMQEQAEALRAREAEIASLQGADRAAAEQALAAQQQHARDQEVLLGAQLRAREREAAELRARQARRKAEGAEIQDRIISLLPLVLEANNISEVAPAPPPARARGEIRGCF